MYFNNYGQQWESGSHNNGRWVSATQAIGPGDTVMRGVCPDSTTNMGVTTSIPREIGVVFTAQMELPPSPHYVALERLQGYTSRENMFGIAVHCERQVYVTIRPGGSIIGALQEAAYRERQLVAECNELRREVKSIIESLGYAETLEERHGDIASAAGQVAFDLREMPERCERFIPPAKVTA